jgi:parallel beta-helix repeat protein
VAGNDVARAGQRAAGRTAKGILLRSVIDAVVVGNTAHHNSNSGISVVGASVGARLVGNTAHGNARGYVRAAAGIDLRNAVSSTVSGNRAYANEDSGINIWAGSHLSTAVNNVVYLNGDHGIDVVQSDDATVVANTVYRNVDSGIEVSGSHRAVITNNITVDNGVDSPRTSGNIRADATSAPTTVIDYNLHSSSADLIDWAGQTYTVLAEFTSATGREAHGIQADPRFRDPAAADFRLTAASPAVDSADSAAPGQPAVDFDALPRVNAPGVRDTGTGPRTYDDRGAFEFHP